MIKQNNNRKESRINVEILDYIVSANGREVTAKEIADAVRSGAVTQTNQWLRKLRMDIDLERPYTIGYNCRKVNNPVTGLPMWVYSYYRGN